MKKRLITLIIVILLILTGVYFYTNTNISNNIKSLANKYTGSLKDFISKGSLITDKELGNLDDSNIDYSTYTVNANTSPYYNMLNTNEKDLYRQIYANADNIKRTFIPKKKVTKEELEETIIAVYNDSPELFWIDTSYSYKYLITGKIAQVTLNYNSTANDINSSKYIFNSNANKIISSANRYSSNYEKEKYVHDYIINTNYYDLNEKLNQSAYSALVTGRTVCAGYSRAFQYIMNRLGITTYYVTGKSFGDNHAWNIVRLSDGYYNVDLTWDDGSDFKYTYFNKTDSSFNSSHTRSRLARRLPSCSATGYAYKRSFINNSNNNYDEEYIKKHVTKPSPTPTPTPSVTPSSSPEEDITIPDDNTIVEEVPEE